MDSETFEQFIDDYNAQDLTRVLSYFTEDAVYSSHSGPEPMGTVYQGKAAIGEALQARFEKTPGARLVLTSPAILQSHGGAAEWYFELTDAMGNTKRLRGCETFQFRDGRITAKHIYMKQQVQPDGR